ncbi:hypothetical protein WDU94_007450 [Cyamophila willieti]
MFYAPTLPSHNQLKLYPNLKEYMGLELTPIHSVTPYNGANSNSTETVAHPSGPNGVTMIAPFFRHGMQKAQVHHGIRELFLCKDIPVGFQFKKGQIIRLVKESSASRNGLLTDHHILEVNGQNVVGLKDKEIRDIVEKAACVINLTIMPSSVYHHMMNKMNFNLVRNTMDHSI